jgi:putative transposase
MMRAPGGEDLIYQQNHHGVWRSANGGCSWDDGSVTRTGWPSGPCQVGGLMSTPSYARHRFPPAIIQHAVWLYFRFALSYRDVEDLLAERGIEVSYETVRRWALKFGRVYPARIRRRRPRPSGRWHLDEVFIGFGGKIHYLWRGVDDEGEVLDIVVQPRRNRKAAVKLLRRLLKRQG